MLRLQLLLCCASAWLSPVIGRRLEKSSLEKRLGGLVDAFKAEERVVSKRALVRRREQDGRARRPWAPVRSQRVTARSTLEADASVTKTRSEPAAYTGALAMLDQACENPKETPAEKWTAFVTMANILNEFKAPFVLHSGLLLGLARSCSIFDGDIDFAVEHGWMKDNWNALEERLKTDGYHIAVSFGKPEEHGFEQNLLSPNSSLQGPENFKKRIKVDLFTYVKSDDGYTWGLWKDDLFNKCRVKSHGFIDFVWKGVKVNVPLPVESALVSLYGPDYMIPRSWQWDEDSFTIGSCERAAPTK
eukprot:TRINITY_DN23258_c0_g1_i1.p1 TRINITY_DN23258_c0_g1~~TRINITY_DN23258_c0_g1_i1.p1  ORF type:complete len:303 (+),score=45.96 TRINITY_DN23258_c0_g1_i1:106-1014(+)